MIFKNNELNIGATAPFQIIHVSDIHLTCADERDDERKRELARGRANVFSHSEEVFAAVCGKARELACPIMFTGDLNDFVSEAGLDRAREFTDNFDVFYTAGNHDFSLYCGEAFEDADYRNISLARVQAAYKNNIRMSSRIINGVNFVALDDGYYRLEDEQTEFLKNEAARGMPIVLMIHVPLYDEEMLEVSRSTHHFGSLTGVADEVSRYMDEEWRREYCPDEATSRAVEYIKSEPLIRAVLTGHLHLSYEGKFDGRVPLFMTSDKEARVITVK